jgi:integrase
MARSASNILVFNDLVVRQAIKDAKDRPQKEWRFERVLNPGKKDHERRAPMPGLVLVTQPTGNAVFYKFYRNQLGKLKKLRLGSYDEIGLEGARKLWEEQTLSVASGSDPVGNKHALREALTFEQLAEDLLKKGKLSATTRANYKRHLKNRINPVIGAKPCETVTGQDVLAICRKAEKKDNFALSNMLKSIIGGVYRYGRNQGLSDNNPCLGIGRRGPKVARDRNPSSDEIAALWNAIDYMPPQEGDDDKRAAQLSPAMKLIIKLGIVTAQRRTEVAGVQRTELIDLDGTDARWVIPGDVNKRGKIIEGRTKNGREQIVPLSPLAVSLFKQALAECADKVHVFPADTTKVKDGKDPRLPHIHGESVSKAVRRLRTHAGVDDVTIHDMRRAIGNYLKNQGIGKEVRDLVLNHADGSVDGQHYSQEARMLKQVRSALELWSRHVEHVVAGEEDEGGQGSNVYAMKRA